ncbi:hypothetical protein ACLOJK_028640 [Asimina triloba]
MECNFHLHPSLRSVFFFFFLQFSLVSFLFFFIFSFPFRFFFRSSMHDRCIHSILPFHSFLLGQMNFLRGRRQRKPAQDSSSSAPTMMMRMQQSNAGSRQHPSPPPLPQPNNPQEQSQLENAKILGDAILGMQSGYCRRIWDCKKLRPDAAAAYGRGRGIHPAPPRGPSLPHPPITNELQLGHFSLGGGGGGGGDQSKALETSGELETEQKTNDNAPALPAAEHSLFRRLLEKLLDVWPSNKAPVLEDLIRSHVLRCTREPRVPITPETRQDPAAAASSSPSPIAISIPAPAPATSSTTSDAESSSRASGMPASTSASASPPPDILTLKLPAVIRIDLSDDSSSIKISRW